MPATEILVFREANGRIPIEDWLDFLPTAGRSRTFYAMRSMNCGRPHHGVQYRILYFFRGRDVVVLSHGTMKRQKVPDVEIRRAVARKRLVLADPQRFF